MLLTYTCIVIATVLVSLFNVNYFMNILVIDLRLIFGTDTIVRLLGQAWASPTLVGNLYTEPSTVCNGQNDVFQHRPQNSFWLTTNSRKHQISFQNIIVLHLAHQIASSHLPCHGGFTAKITGFPNMIYTVNHALEGFTLKITDSPNMVCMVYHATGDLQWKLLTLQIWLLWSTMWWRIYVWWGLLIIQM